MCTPCVELDQLKGWMEAHGEKSFRAKQIYEWIWKKNVDSIAGMTNLSKPLREKLEGSFAMGKVGIQSEQRSSDGTIKYAFQLWDGKLVEGVLIPTPGAAVARSDAHVHVYAHIH